MSCSCCSKACGLQASGITLCITWGPVGSYLRIQQGDVCKLSEVWSFREDWVVRPSAPTLKPGSGRPTRPRTQLCLTCRTSGLLKGKFFRPINPTVYLSRGKTQRLMHTPVSFQTHSHILRSSTMRSEAFTENLKFYSCYSLTGYSLVGQPIGPPWLARAQLATEPPATKQS